MNYKYKKSHTIIYIIVYSIIIILWFIYAITLSNIKSIILPISFLMFGMYIQIKSDKMFNIYIDEDILVAKVNKGWVVNQGCVSEQTLMPLTDITIIKSYTEYIIIKKVEICTRYKCVRLNIKNFKNYKEMLQLLVSRTEKNMRIKINDNIYDMLK